MKKLTLISAFLISCIYAKAQKYTYTSDRFLITDAVTKEESVWSEITTFIIAEGDIINIKVAPKFESSIYSIDTSYLSTDKNTIIFNAHAGKKEIILNITGWRRNEGMATLFIQGQSKYIKMHISGIQ